MVVGKKNCTGNGATKNNRKYELLLETIKRNANEKCTENECSDLTPAVPSYSVHYYLICNPLPVMCTYMRREVRYMCCTHNFSFIILYIINIRASV